MARRIDPSLIPPAPTLEYECALWDQGIEHVAGLDEAGRGALAGPVFAAAVVLPANRGIAEELHGVRDSKQMSANQRQFWQARIRSAAGAWAIGSADSREIDQIGILPATRLACLRALEALDISPGHLLIDALLLHDSHLPQTSLLKGDARALSIAAASVLAKVFRDDEMRRMHRARPRYGWAQNKGYGTVAHRRALQSHGPSPHHRVTFAPLRETLKSA